MPRELVLANGRLHVALDEAYEIRDLYWPRVGHENHAIGRRSRFGVAVGDRFAWVGEKGWTRALRYHPGTLATRVALRSRALGVALRCEDAVLPDADVLVRRVVVEKTPAPVTLFFHLDLDVSGTDVGDTATHDPLTGGVLHYKRDRWFLANGASPGRVGAVEWACGRKAFREHDATVRSRSSETSGSLVLRNELEGTWRDAEDGALSGNSTSHGACDSVVALKPAKSRGGETVAWWWLAAGSDEPGVFALDNAVRKNPDAHLSRALAWWGSLTARKPLSDSSAAIARASRQSLAILLANVDAGGGILAANDTDITSFNRDTYSYVWGRDAAFVAHALDVAGHPEPAARFLRFAADLFRPEGFLDHKHTVDGLLASTWHARSRGGAEALPIQEDETALVTWEIAEHVRRFGDWRLALEVFERAVRRPAEWMMRFRDAHALPLASWDPWEERRGQLAYTTATVIAALEGAAFLAHGLGDAARAARWREAAGETRSALARFWIPRKKRFARMIREDGTLDDTEDASLVMLAWLGALPATAPRVRATLDHVFARLEVAGPVGGTARYVDDRYHRIEEAEPDLERYPGNPWFVCSLWKADWLAMTRRKREAREVLAWAAKRARPSGVMAEQLDPRNGSPLSVAPLTWSHAAFVESAWRAA